MSIINADIEYFRLRASAERQQALRSDLQAAAAIHEELARRYQTLVDQAVRPSTLHLAVPGSEPAWKSSR